ncbi:MAG: MFS transporter [Candidatus Korarchaeota archaeon]|nr:MFS transporter [Candidatus Korarchaeota archaeon]
MKSRDLIFLSLLSLAISTNIYISVPNLDLISKEFVVNDLIVSIIAGSFFFFFGLAAAIWGFIIGKYDLNRKKGLMYTTLLAAVFDIIASISNSAYLLLSCNVVIGISLGFSIPAIYSVIVDYFPIEERLFAIAVWNLLSSIGSTIGYAFAFASGILGNWRFAFIIASFTLMLSILALLVIKEPLKGQSEEILTDLFNKGLSYDYLLNERNFLVSLSRKTNFLLAVQSFFTSAGWGAYMGWGIHFMTREAHLDKVQSAAILGLVGIGGATSVLLSRAVQKFQKIDLRVKLFLAGIFVAVEGSSYIIMYTLLRITNLNIATQDIMTSIMLLLSTLAHNAVFLIAILVGAFGNFMGSSAGPIRGSIISEINAPEEKSALIGTMMVAEHIGRSLGIFTVGLISFLVSSLYFGLIASFSLYYLGSIAWFLTNRYYHNDRKKLLETLAIRKEILLKKHRTQKNE